MRSTTPEAIAGRQPQRSLLLAEGSEIAGAHLDSGQLSIDLVRPEPAATSRQIEITTGTPAAGNGRILDAGGAVTHAAARTA